MNTGSASPSASGSAAAAPEILYKERQWVPWYFWLMAAFVVAITTATVSLNRNIWWVIIPAVLLSAIAIWVLIAWSGTVLKVEKDTDGTRWLTIKDAQLPHDVVQRSMILVTHGWIDEHIMLVLDDPEDPTPYWLIATKNPQQVLDAFLDPAARPSAH